MLKQLAIVALGGGVGSALRYLTSLWAGKLFATAFPLGTFVVNVLGCFLIGLFIGLSHRFIGFDDNIKLLLITGFCGGYTTFSAFSAENAGLYQSENYWMLALYLGASVVLGFLALLGGDALSKVAAH